MNKRETKNIEEELSERFEEYMELETKISSDDNPKPVTFASTEE